jgi:hypothetical protein
VEAQAGSRFRQKFRWVLSSGRGDYGRLRSAGLWTTDDLYVLYIVASAYVDETNEAKPCHS